MVDIIFAFSLAAAGVFSIGSSISRSIIISFEEESLSESESSILTLLTELERAVLSALGIDDHKELDILLGESSTVFPKLLLVGI